MNKKIRDELCPPAAAKGNQKIPKETERIGVSPYTFGSFRCKPLIFRILAINFSEEEGTKGTISDVKDGNDAYSKQNDRNARLSEQITVSPKFRVFISRVRFSAERPREQMGLTDPAGRIAPQQRISRWCHYIGGRKERCKWLIFALFREYSGFFGQKRMGGGSED